MKKDWKYSAFLSGKKLSVSYSHYVKVHPIIRKNSGVPYETENYALLFQIVFHRRQNKRASLFYLFQKHYYPGKSSEEFLFIDQYIDEATFQELIEDEFGKRPWPLSDLILLEKEHVENIFSLVAEWKSDEFSLSNWSEVYEKATIFPIDIIEERVYYDILLEELNKILPPVYIGHPSYNIRSKTLKFHLDNFGLVDSYKYYINEMKNFNLDISEIEVIGNKIVKDFESFREFLRPKISFHTTIDDEGNMVKEERVVKNLAMFSNWFQENYKNRLLEFINQQELEYSNIYQKIIIDIDNYYSILRKDLIQMLKS